MNVTNSWLGPPTSGVKAGDLPELLGIFDEVFWPKGDLHSALL